MGREQLVFNFPACKIIRRIEPAGCDLMNEPYDEVLRGVPRGGRARRCALATLTGCAIWVPLSSRSCSGNGMFRLWRCKGTSWKPPRQKKSSPGSDDQGQRVIESRRMSRNLPGSGKCAGFPGEGDRSSFALASQLRAPGPEDTRATRRHEQDLASWIGSGMSCSKVTGARTVPGRPCRGSESPHGILGGDTVVLGVFRSTQGPCIGAQACPGDCSPTTDLPAREQLK